MNSHRVKRLAATQRIKIAFIAAIFSYLSGCDSSHPPHDTENNNQLSFEIPQIIRQVQSVENTDLTLEVSLNNELPRAFNITNNTDFNYEGEWSVTIEAPQFSQNTLLVSWFVTYENTKLLIASQQSLFNTTDQPLAFTPGENYTSFGSAFDFDGDGFSNLSELNAETDPLRFDVMSQIAIEPELLSVPASCFSMGSEETEAGRLANESLHQACISDFKIGKYEVTFEEYDRYTLATGKSAAEDNNWGRGTLPVINVTHADATDYARWLSEQTDKRYRLPTETEWELAARAETTTTYNTGDSLSVFVANFDSIMQRSTPVGSYPSNTWSLFDIHGNVAEWTCSAFSIEYNGPEQLCDSSSSFDTEFSYRGGSWRSPLEELRSAQRNHASSSYKNIDLGFRLALDN